jgi:hypothetical protein
VERLEADFLRVEWPNVYVTAVEAGDATKRELWRLPGKEPPMLVTSDLPPIADMALYAPLMLVTTNPGDSNAGEVLAIPLDGSGPPRHLASNRRAPGAVVGVDRSVFWGEEGIDSSGQPFGAIMTAPLFDDGGATTFRAMDADEVPRQLRWIEWGPGPSDLLGPVVEWLYWTTGDPLHPAPGRGEVHGCALPPLASPVVRADEPDGGGAGSIDQDPFNTPDGDLETRLLYAGPQGITAVTVEPDGSIAARDFIPTGGFVGQIASGSPDTVYFVDPSSGALMAHVFQDAGSTRRLATGLDPGTPLTTDDACVYWIDARAGNVMMTLR